MLERVPVLVVEDDALILMDIALQLETEGFRVHMATNADAAIELLHRHNDIRLLFTDIDMPGSMDGLKLAAAVRERWPPVRIIVTSGARLVEITDLPDGSVFFSKPYDHSSVVGAMREMLA
jgi:two-component system, response regulator PdtaR